MVRAARLASAASEDVGGSVEGVRGRLRYSPSAQPTARSASLTFQAVSGFASGVAGGQAGLQARAPPWSYPDSKLR